MTEKTATKKTIEIADVRAYAAHELCQALGRHTDKRVSGPAARAAVRMATALGAISAAEQDTAERAVHGMNYDTFAAWWETA